MDLYYCNFSTPWPKPLWEVQLHSLCENWRNKIMRYHRWQDQHAALIGKLLLKKVFSERHGIHNPEKVITFNAYGKPKFETGFSFNLSHSGDFVLLCVDSKGNVGVDIEKIKADFNILEFQSVFPKAIWQNILQSTTQESTFFYYWSLIESLIKADGRGLSAPLKGITIHPENETANLGGNIYYYREVEISKQYKAFVSADHFFSMSRVECIDFEAKKKQ